MQRTNFPLGINKSVYSYSSSYYYEVAQSLPAANMCVRATSLQVALDEPISLICS